MHGSSLTNLEFHQVPFLVSVLCVWLNLSALKSLSCHFENFCYPIMVLLCIFVSYSSPKLAGAS